MATQGSEIDFNHWLYRFIAIFVDSIITSIIGWVIYNFAIAPLLWSVNFGFGVSVVVAPWWGGVFVLPLIYGLILLIYSAVMEVSSGATIGKKIVGLQAQMVNGGKLDFGKAFMRNISKIYGLFLLLDWLIGIATPGADRKQKYTDRMAGTTVVSIKQPFSAGVPPPPPPPT